MDGEGWQDSVSLSLGEDFAAVWFDFDSDDGAVSEQDAREDSAAAAGK